MKCKRMILYLFALLFIMPIFVNAKEYCTIVSGNGRDVGSEIACGTEHFYIVDFKDDEVKMISKYNLYVGDKIDYFDTDVDWVYSDVSYAGNVLYSDGAFDYCMEDAAERGYNPYYVYPILEEEMHDDNVNAHRSLHARLVGCRVYEKLEYEHVLQDERAKGFKYVDGKSILPIYGITYMEPRWGYDAIVNDIIKENEYDDNGNLTVEGSSFEGYLNGYKDELTRQEINVKEVSFITLTEVFDLIKKISGRDVETNFVFPSLDNPIDYTVGHVGKTDIKGYIPDDFKWLYDFSYWLGSGFYLDDYNENYSTYNDYFISNEGMLCLLGRDECSYFNYPIGNGLRTLVTMDPSNIKFLIETETDDNGTIEVIRESYAGEEISFVLTSKSGYHLESLTLRTESGLNVEFTEITENVDGTIIVGTSRFVMPFENIKIIANWAKDEEPEPEPTPTEPEEKETSSEYNIETIIDGDGKVEVVDKSIAGENIEFTAKTMNGSKLVSLEIKTNDGRTINFTKVNENNESVTNKFTMPEDDVVITAKFETIVPVPKTGDNITKYVAILAISLIVLVSLSIIGIKNNKTNEI